LPAPDDRIIGLSFFIGMLLEYAFTPPAPAA
jgi:hypothetical protein